MRFLKSFFLSLIAIGFFASSAFGANWYVSSTKWTACTAWAALTSYNVGDLRRQLAIPTVGDERVFRCTTAGISGAAEPSWTLTEGGTTDDATAVWTEVTGLETYGWAASHARLANAYAWGAADDVFWPGDDHAETQASTLTLTSPGTAASPCKVICVDDSAEPPTAVATTATITTTGASSMTFGGFAYYHGVTFNVGTGPVQAYLNFNSIDPWFLEFRNCGFNLITTASGTKFLIGVSSTSADDHGLTLIDTTISFSHTSQGINSLGRFFMQGGSVGSGAAIPAALFLPIAGAKGVTILRGADLSNLGSGKSLVKVDVAGTTTAFNFMNCKLGASVSVISGSIIGQGGVNVYLDACDSGDPSSGPRSEAYTYQGSVITNTGIVRSGGASDGTAYSLKMTANATGVSFISPLVTRPIFKVADTTGSPITVTAHIAMEEGATPLTEAQCWAEVEYMGTAGSTLTSFLTDNGSSTALTASTTDQDTSTETWTGFTGAPVKQKLAVTFTPAEKGFYMVRIYLARPAVATTGPPVYVCPKLVVS
ncbi:MAG: hypothetical protein WA151_11330 [Desulfatirhabdiaceae bacterium]